MPKITYLLGAGASYNSCPILEAQAEKMIELSESEVLKVLEPINEWEKTNGIWLKFDEQEINRIPDSNKYKILWYIGYFGKKAIEYNTIDTYARKLFLNDEHNELKLLKMAVSVFFDLWENFYSKKISLYKNHIPSKIDNRYKSLFSILLQKSKDNRICLDNNFKFITWNYDLQLEQTFQMFLGQNYSSDLNDINNLIRFKEEQGGNTENDIFHLNGHRGFFKHKSSNEEKELILNVSTTIDDYWKNLDSLYESILKGKADFNNYIKYAWEHDLKSNFFQDIIKVIEETEVLVIIGYSFPAFNREIDQFLFSKLDANVLKKIVYQDPNATEEMIINLFDDIYYHEETKIEIINNERSLKQFHLPNEFFNPQTYN